MNIPGILLIAIGIIFLIYSVIDRNKININRRDKFIIVDRQKLLTLQLCCSIFNSVCMIIWGTIIVIYNLSGLNVVLYGFIFIFINYMIIPIGINKGYIKNK